MRPLGLVAVAMAALLLTACGASDADTGTAFVAGDGSIVLIAPDERQPAPDLVGPTLEGGEFRLSDHLGDVVVLNVWASWCAPCRAEAPVLEDVWREVKDDGVQFVGLDTRDTEAAALAFLDRYGVTYPNVIDTDGRLQLLFSDTLPPQAIPSTLVVDREGRVAGRILGRVTDATLTALIDDVAR
ncbi:MAG: TlpA family protein disulfide reductase [Candidatus Nanopelagicales bacterium]|jgi:thiol-disulfide isomerase/thioredoxin|nr:TlpA family protein disulfide reductase [Candidatus Nanopelagicales bacterium]MDP4715434.1 TlpA family protein disulfide reductase [Candidatus Nanopelagicales bacterium]MDP4906850.1 TlpA family protein disulfide reductase [Candidatus Nanopelagicales bacterium]MDP4975540.1 TlpA family protein disulfide reductase [Candidatus Nanopelagicales bacterium]